MNFISSFVRSGLLIFISTVTLSLPAHAGSIFFGLSINGDKVTLTNQGNSSAYYPVVMHLLPDGRWEALAPALENAPPAELAPGAQFNLLSPKTTPQQTPFSLDVFQPIMVRFFDQAGNDFGQISFFNQPPITSESWQTGYAHGLMTITPPSDAGSNGIRAGWLLWPQEEGIAPLTGPLTFKHTQPPARRIEWQPNMNALRLNLGAGLPSAILLHETGNGYMLQNVNGGGTQGVQQRASWLDAGGIFYTLTALAALAATVLILRQLDGTWRKRPTP